MVFFQNGLNPFRQDNPPLMVDDSCSEQLTWDRPPVNILVIKKAHDPLVIQPFLLLVEWLAIFKNMTVFVEEKVIQEPAVSTNPSFEKFGEKLKTFGSSDDLTDRIDLAVCLGGDGTLLYVSSLFKKSVPPVMAFHMGSLGFLAPFKFDNFDDLMNRVFEGQANLILRSRLRCTLTNVSSSGDRVEDIQVLNEIVIDRGPSRFLVKIDLYANDRIVTTVQGDGLIISTPTGSTGYSGSAGGPMVNPSVPTILITPICPHSLSFRPILAPVCTVFKIVVNPDSRCTPWVSFDGQQRLEMKHGDSVRVTNSVYSLPSVTLGETGADWYGSLNVSLNWNAQRAQVDLDGIADISIGPCL